VILAQIVSMLRRRKIEAALAQREEQLSTLLDALPDSVCFKDGAGRWLLANAACLRLFGLEESEYRGKTDQELALTRELCREVFLGCQASDEAAWESRQMLRTEEVIAMPGRPEELRHHQGAAFVPRWQTQRLGGGGAGYHRA